MHRRFVTALLGIAVAAAAVAGPAGAPAGSYQRVESWAPVPVPGGPAWEMAGVAVRPDGGRLVLARRVDAPLVEVDATAGTILRTWGTGLLAWPHSVTFDPEGNLWVVDAAIGAGAAAGLNPPIPSAVAAGRGHQVFKLAPDGRVLLALGTAGRTGADASHFHAPTGVAFGRNGDIFVSDGHGGATNARVVVFDRDGRFLRTWGTRGSGPEQFGEPHGILVDPDGRVLVADRSNGRVAVYTQDGTLLALWTGLGRRPCSMAVGPGRTLYVTSHDTRAHEDIITLADLRDGRVLEVINPALEGLEGIAVDGRGTIYVTSATGHAAARYERR